MGGMKLVRRTHSALSHSVCNNKLFCPFIPRNDGTFEWFRMTRDELAMFVCFPHPGVKLNIPDDRFRILVLTLLSLTTILDTEYRE